MAAKRGVGWGSRWGCRRRQRRSLGGAEPWTAGREEELKGPPGGFTTPHLSSLPCGRRRRKNPALAQLPEEEKRMRGGMRCTVVLELDLERQGAEMDGDEACVAWARPVLIRLIVLGALPLSRRKSRRGRRVRRRRGRYIPEAYAVHRAAKVDWGARTLEHGRSVACA